LEHAGEENLADEFDGLGGLEILGLKVIVGEEVATGDFAPVNARDFLLLKIDLRC